MPSYHLLSCNFETLLASLVQRTKHVINLFIFTVLDEKDEDPPCNTGSVHSLGRLKFSGNVASKADQTLQSFKLGLARVLRS